MVYDMRGTMNTEMNEDIDLTDGGMMTDQERDALENELRDANERSRRRPAM